MARILATAGGNAVWAPGEKLTVIFTGTRTIRIDDEDRKILLFRNADGSSCERWASAAFLDPISKGQLKEGNCLSIISHPKRGKGKKQFCPFDISILEPGDIGYFA